MASSSPASRVRIEFDSERKIRYRNKLYYRFLHWPLWITVFFLVPGPLTFDLFEHGFDSRMGLWLLLVLAGTGIAGLCAQLPGVEAAPYIIRFTEDKPNPLYRRICYTFAWSAVITYAVLNLAGLIYALMTGIWQMKQIYEIAYFPTALVIWALGLSGHLPRVKASTKGEGQERRYFYGSVWAVTIAQPILGILWVTLPKNTATTILKLAVFVGTLAVMGYLSYRGRLPRTQEIVPGTLAVCD